MTDDRPGYSTAVTGVNTGAALLLRYESLRIRTYRMLTLGSILSALLSVGLWLARREYRARTFARK